MIDRLNHVAIAVPQLEAAIERYRDSLGAQVSPPTDLPEHGVRVAFIELINTRIELMEPLGDDSPIRRFLDANPDGGIHHLCYEVDDIETCGSRLAADGIRLLAGGIAKDGAHGRPVLFVHPKDTNGCLIELEEAPTNI